MITASEIRRHSRVASLLSERPSRLGNIEWSNQPSAQLTGIFEILIEECKVEAEQAWAQEKESSQQIIRDLRGELAKEQAKVRKAESQISDWQGKYEKLKEKLTGLMGDV